MRKTQLKVCIIMPAYNEAAVIGCVIDDIRDTFKSEPYTFEIVVVNDSSKDDTGKIARDYDATVIDHIINCGAGGATATGLSYAQRNDFDIAVTMDSDGQHLASDALRGVNEIIKRNVDLLIGSRLISSSDMPLIKIVGNKGLSLITYFLFGINSTDSQSGLRIFSKKAQQKLRWETSGYEFCSEMLWRAKQLNLNINEFPINTIYTKYSKSKGQNNWNGVNILKSLLKQRVKELLR